MSGRCQVERHEVRVRIPRGIEIDRRLHARPFRLRHRWVGAKQIIESQTSPPRDRTPAFNANQPRNLFMHRNASQEIPNIERDAQARSEPIQSQFPSRNIAGIGSSSVVVVLERSNLRFGVGGHPAIYRVERPHYGLRYGSAPATGNFQRLRGRPPLVSPLKSCMGRSFTAVTRVQIPSGTPNLSTTCRDLSFSALRCSTVKAVSPQESNGLPT